MKRKGYVSPAKASRMLGVHRNTVYNWARDAVEGRPSRFTDVQRHPVTGYLGIRVDEVKRAKEDD